MKVVVLLISIFMSLHAISLDKKVEYLDSVKELIIMTQTLRGNTNVYMKADKTDETLLLEDRTKVMNALQKLGHTLKTEDISVDKEFRRLSKYMNSLNKVAVELNPLDTYKANSLLIKKMLEIGAKVQNTFFKDDKKLYKDASFIMIDKVLPMTEHIGQLRGLSSGIIACGHCNDNEDDLEYIKDYLAYVYDDLNELVLDMKLMQKTYPKNYPKNINYQLHKLEVDIKHYLSHIEEVLIEGKKMKDSECDFFAEGTSLIKMTLKYYNMNESVLKD